MTDRIKLRTDSILYANFDVLPNDFTFIVNGEHFPTSRFIASLLSPVVSNLLSTDKSISSYPINTESNGNFETILKIFSCREAVILNDKEFLREILEQLQNQSLQIEFHSNISQITYENFAFSDFLNHLKSPHFYREIIDKEITIISSNLYKILSKEEERINLYAIDLEIVERIVSHKNLVIKTEDQLLEFINSLYKRDHESSFLYQYVSLSHCSLESLQTFLSEFRIDDINEPIWNEIKQRLEHSIRIPISLSNLSRYYEKISKGNDNFDGIINTIRKQTHNNDIKTEIEITASSSVHGKDDPYNTIQYDNTNFFESKNVENSWLCFEFKNHLIIPTHYTIRSYRREQHGWWPRNHKVEVSIDNVHWEVIHEENGCSFPNEKDNTSLFCIDENKQIEAKFIRITQTGLNSNNNNGFVIDSIEFYGYIN